MEFGKDYSQNNKCCLRLLPFAGSSALNLPQHICLATLLLRVIGLLDGGLSLPVLVRAHHHGDIPGAHPHWLWHIAVTVLSLLLQRPAVLGELDDLPVGAVGHMHRLLCPGDVVTGVVGTDPHVHVGVVAATLDQVGLDPLLRDLVRGVVRARDGLLPRTDRHDGD